MYLVTNHRNSKFEIQEVRPKEILEFIPRIRLYGFHSWLKLQPYFLIGGDH